MPVTPALGSQGVDDSLFGASSNGSHQEGFSSTQVNGLGEASLKIEMRFPFSRART